MDRYISDEKTSDVNQKHYTIPFARNFERVTRKMSLTEKLILWLLVALTAVGTGVIMWQIHSSMLVAIPAYDGTLKEGIIGTPGPINPLLASSAADRTLSGLIYAGLMKATPEGEVVPELAENYQVSEDGTEYVFELDPNAVFHDKEAVTAEDVVFTVEKIKDPAVRSTLAADWNNIQVEAVDKSTVKFILPEKSTDFPELATLGILPEHLWKSVDGNRFAFSSLNVEPVGAGPYQVSSVSMKDSNPTKYELRSFKDYIKGEPYITNIVLPFYSEERKAWMALQKGEIDSLAGFSPKRVDTVENTDTEIRTTPLPRVFAIFINQNNNEALADKDIRKALSEAVDREEILEKVLNGKGETATGPVSFQMKKEQSNDPEKEDEGNSTPSDMLAEAGWEYDEELGGLTDDGESIMTIEISTVANSDLETAAEVVKRNWEELGIKTEIALYGSNELSQNILRPRDFEALLFGYILDREFDLFPFWHSSERDDPGMNLSLYANLTVDELLEEYQKTGDVKEREEILEKIDKEVKADVPAIFLYSPHFLYAIPKELQNIELGHLISPEERFLDVHNWFLKTDKVWEFLL
ncbi:MAG: ABC transporter substrate-binding protein [Candidatus Paceibacterota bacterium]